MHTHENIKVSVTGIDITQYKWMITAGCILWLLTCIGLAHYLSAEGLWAPHTDEISRSNTSKTSDSPEASEPHANRNDSVSNVHAQHHKALEARVSHLEAYRTHTDHRLALLERQTKYLQTLVNALNSKVPSALRGYNRYATISPVLLTLGRVDAENSTP
jgi:hypothetical protein